LLKPQQYDIFTDADHNIQTWRGYYQFHCQECETYLIYITKQEYSKKQEQLKYAPATQVDTSGPHFTTHRLPKRVALAVPGTSALPELAKKRSKEKGGKCHYAEKVTFSLNS
jgi:hypothetical protein